MVWRRVRFGGEGHSLRPKRRPDLIDKMDAEASSTQTPFLVPCYVRPHAFHPLALFEDRKLPTADEHQLYAFENSTTLADVCPSLSQMQEVPTADLQSLSCASS
jgi:hypothetical protein